MEPGMMLTYEKAMRLTDKLMYFYGYEFSLSPQSMRAACTILEHDTLFRFSLLIVYLATSFTLRFLT